MKAERRENPATNAVFVQTGCLSKNCQNAFREIGPVAADFEITNRSQAYKAIASNLIMASRHRRIYAKVSAARKEIDLSSPLCGQALAGSGALVFEGELLELPN